MQRNEYAASNHVALDFGGPDHPTQSGAACRREVEVSARILLKELLERLCFVRGEIVHQDVIS